MDLLIYAAVAAIMFVALFRVLGTRHGEEPVKRNPFAEAPSFQKSAEAIVVPSTEVPTPEPSVAANASAEVQQALFQMALIDRNFDATQFAANAKEAYRIVVEAYAHDDKNTLQELLTPKVYDTFKRALDERLQHGEKLEIEIRVISRAEIIDAKVDGNSNAEITLRFTSEQIRVTRNSNGEIIEGSSQFPDRLVDDWTFGRRLNNPDPRWLVTETEDGDPTDGPL